MAVKTKSFAFPCPVADTESGPIITWEEYNLKLEFVTYQNQSCVIIFEEVSHFQFVSEDELSSKTYQYDGAVEVVESEVIAKLISVGEIDKTEANDFKHIVIGFNEIGSYVIVVFKTMVAKCA